MGVSSRGTLSACGCLTQVLPSSWLISVQKLGFQFTRKAASTRHPAPLVLPDKAWRHRIGSQSVGDEDEKPPILGVVVSIVN
jgi:hypothetical protein